MKPLKILLLILTFAFTCTVIGQTVYTTNTGEKYHKSSCRYLKYSKKEYTLKKVKALGFTACSVCKPNAENTKEIATSNALSQNKTSSTTVRKTTATQCTGKTKARKRCKRKTKNANGRCYQH